MYSKFWLPSLRPPPDYLAGFRFDLVRLVLRTYSVAVKTVSILGYFGMIGGFLGLLFTRSIFSPSPPVISAQVAAVLLFGWARLTFGRRSFHKPANPTEGGLVTCGPYRYIRHSIYAAFCLFTSAGVAAHWSWRTGLWDGLVLGSALVRIFCEEALVSARYPEYGQYSANTWRMIPYVF
jgi:protein-S-isoprenylcysteine O-methyltransferase Ste14